MPEHDHELTVTDSTGDLARRALGVLDANRRGAWTCPSTDLYPHQWLWDSCFVAIGLARHDPARAADELPRAVPRAVVERDGPAHGLRRGRARRGRHAHLAVAEQPARATRRRDVVHHAATGARDRGVAGRRGTPGAVARGVRRRDAPEARRAPRVALPGARPRWSRARHPVAPMGVWARHHAAVDGCDRADAEAVVGTRGGWVAPRPPAAVPAARHEVRADHSTPERP